MISKLVIKYPTFFYSLLIFIFAFALYSNTLKNKYAIDDEIVVLNNPQIAKGFQAIPEIFSSYYVVQSDHSYGYRPVTKATFAIEYSLFGLNPYKSHLINVVLYALLCVLIFIVSKKLFRVPGFFIFLAVLIFTAHPLHTEVVASLKNREEILCFIFGIISVYFFSFPFRGLRLLFIFPGLIFLILSVLTKQNGVVFALIIPLNLFFFSSRSYNPQSFILPRFGHILAENAGKVVMQFKRIFNFRQYVNYLKGLKPAQIKMFFIMGSLLIILLSAAYQSVKIPEKRLPANSVVEKWHNPAYVDKSDTLKTSLALQTHGFYLKKLFVPEPLLFYYGYNMFPDNGAFSFTNIISLISFVMMLLLAFVLLGPRHIISYSVLFYLFSISIFLNYLMPIAGIVGERLVFIASWGWSLLAAYVLFAISGYYQIKKNKKVQLRPRVIFTFLFFLSLLVYYSSTVFNRNSDWKNHLSLAAADAPKAPESFFINTFYATMLENEYQKNSNISLLNKSIYYYKKGLEVYNRYDISYNNLGRIYLEELKKPDSAIFYLSRSVEINPGNHFALFNLAFAYEQSGYFNLARSLYLACIIKKPDFEMAPLMLANLYYFRLNKPDSAYYYNKLVIDSNPKNDAPYLNMGNYAMSRKDTVNAMIQYEKAIEANPYNTATIYNVYRFYARKGNFQKADFYKQFLN